jgi:hypothetical protein
LFVQVCNVEIGYRADSVEMKDCVVKAVDVAAATRSAPLKPPAGN